MLDGLKKTVLLATAAAAISAAGLATASADPIADRKAAMQAVLAGTKISGAMAKGEMTFDAVTAELAARAMNGGALGFDTMFPAGSETGGETTAAPKIWEDMAGFKAALVKFQADTAAMVPAAKEGAEAFKAAFGKAAGNCQECHQTFRVKKN